MKKILTYILLLAACAGHARLNGLQSRLDAVADSCDISIALITWQGDTLTAGDKGRRDMASVVKFYQAAAMAQTVPFDTLVSKPVEITTADLPGGTWSPLRASTYALPDTLVPAQLLDYSLMVSDNNAFDILCRHFLSPAQIDSTLRSRSLASDFNIAFTEAQMHADSTRRSLNTATALDATKLIYRFFTSDTTASSTLVKAIMARESPFGASRIPGGIPANSAKIFHKTGTGFTDADGSVAAVNDLAFVSYATDGGYRCYALGVFIGNAATQAAAEETIAKVSNMVWQAIIVDEAMAMNRRGTAPAASGPVPPSSLPATDEEQSSWIEGLTEVILDEIVFPAIFD